ncbi:MAG: hypothetical protein KW802_00060 [Candidatus Doudnabacteria bacterium]|nr:hypothetical protein [Candidatus Doudnabacteria bacterium]
MYLKKKMRTRLILLAIVVLLFLYWRGVKNVSAAKGWDCNFHVVYTVCSSKNSKAQLPSFFDIIKAGAKF